jgi:hypothetical protein
MKTKIPFVLFSAERAGFTDDVNEWRTQSCERQLRRGLPDSDFIYVDGCYKGASETSFLVLLPQGDSSYRFHEVARLAARWGQESILYVDANRSAVLCYLGLNGMIARMEALGEWHEVLPEDARKLTAYTSYAGRYFTATKAG